MMDYLHAKLIKLLLIKINYNPKIDYLYGCFIWVNSSGYLLIDLNGKKLPSCQISDQNDEKKLRSFL